MAKYTCVVCNQPITDYDDSLFVKIQKPYGNLLKTVPVHKGDCDNRLEAYGRANELNTNSSMEISSFGSDEERTNYMNGK